MYLTDANNDVISVANMDTGLNATHILTAPHIDETLIHPYAVAIAGDQLFFTDWQLK